MTPSLHDSYKLSFGIYDDILQAGLWRYTRAWKSYLTRSTIHGGWGDWFYTADESAAAIIQQEALCSYPYVHMQVVWFVVMTTALCCLPTWVWLCAFWLVLGSPGVCTAALQWQFDGVLLPILPSLNRSCCHLYFDLCIPWSIYACERWEGRRGEEGAGGKKEDGNNYNTCCYTRGNACGTFAF